MIGSEISLLAAFLGGALTLLAPCSVMLLPAFFAYAFNSPRALLSRTAVFWLGLVSTLVPLGAAASTAGALLREHMGVLVLVGGLLLVVLGLLQALAVPVHMPGLGMGFGLRRRGDRNAGLAGVGPATGQAARRDAASPLAVYLLGALYGLAGVGCSGPILGAVLVLAGLGGEPLRAAVMMLVYGVGMVAPLALLALLWDSARLRERSWLRPRPVRVLGRQTTVLELLGGLVCVALGVVMVLIGPQGLGGGLLSVERMAQLEDAVLSRAALVPWWLLAGIVGFLVAAVVVARRR
ncbi:Cytochrome C biogenesis protein transmembrane region [Actinomyces bovis]|uniref:Cytochrome C biogenesis protein transmembrane region n=1 Tax=Actinomyces bovis TaxID=1658 RepID=A0ABY1VQK9_9ACTO|nr:cytochrome c biogenesis protein CcdA [Actinomyces bovis]SPT54421.1 Cytochrome C biogenesis protein transmembrane region [Actinomyces bovis]VEG55993.1 Cytochrome C biogenesis protein transmembrane region [Actinomyces israelii]